MMETSETNIAIQYCCMLNGREHSFRTYMPTVLPEFQSLEKEFRQHLCEGLCP